MASYFMPNPADGLLQNIITWARTGKRFRPSFPRAVQFQTLSTCNAKCIFCPHCHYPEEIRHGRMDDTLISKITEECKRHFVGRVSPYLTNEPLLDKRVPKILQEIKKRRIIPIKTKINTNAALLNENIGRELIAAKLDQLWISVNGYSEDTYTRSMGLDFSTTMRNIDGFLALQKQVNKPRPKVIVTTLRTNLVEHELDYAQKYWQERNVDFRIHHMDNRTGENVAQQSHFDAALQKGFITHDQKHTEGHWKSKGVNLKFVNIDEPEKEKNNTSSGSPITRIKYKRNCDLFLKQAYIVENGDMIICCHDWRQSVVVGNIKNQSIAEVWNSDRFKSLIYEYYAENFDNLEICRICG